MVVYIDDILIYSGSLEEHAEHLRKVFQKLKENKLYAKLEKCEFGVTKVDFLGHRITQEGLKMDNHKVKAIVDWEPPKSVPALRFFLVSLHDLSLSLFPLSNGNFKIFPSN